MAFFKKKHKKLALSSSKEQLEKAYHKSEAKLKIASKTGNEKLLSSAMHEHGCYEYALLYKETPEYLRKKRRFLSKRK